MYAVATFLVVAVITTVFTTLSTGALIATGLPPTVASFQARSAFSGAGFTTTEAENVVNHPTRRRIIAATMLVGSLGTPTLVVTVLLGFVAPGPGSTIERTLVVTAGTLAVLLVIGNRPMQRVLQRVGSRYTRRRLMPALAGQRRELLSLGDDHIVAAIDLEATPSDTSRSLRGLQQAFGAAAVLGIKRGDRFHGEPPVDIELHEGDQLVVCAARERLDALGFTAPDAGWGQTLP